MDDLMLRSPWMGESDEGWGEGIKYMQILLQRLIVAFQYTIRDMIAEREVMELAYD